MVPLSWLLSRMLRRETLRLSVERGAEHGRAQIVQQRQVSHGWRDGAAQLVVLPLTAREAQVKGDKREQRHTHSAVRLVMLPMEAGMVPLSLLLARMLRGRCTYVLSAELRGRTEVHIQTLQIGEAAQRGRDGSVQRVIVEVAAWEVDAQTRSKVQLLHAHRSCTRQTADRGGNGAHKVVLYERAVRTGGSAQHVKGRASCDVNVQESHSRAIAKSAATVKEGAVAGRNPRSRGAPPCFGGPPRSYGGVVQVTQC